MINLNLFACLFISYLLTSHATQVEYLDKWIKSRRSNNLSYQRENLPNEDEYHPVYIGPQNGLMKADKIDALPGQPEGVNFNQYSGHVTVDPKAEKALFYYFAESPENSSTKPLVLWLNGGPGCSSLIGAMEEHGPFRVNGDGKTLFRNNYAWNNVANVLYLESPAGVGFSYSNKSANYGVGDKLTAEESYTFLVNWLERFPQYKTRDFYITGESYAGHYVPQLAYKIILNNQNTNRTLINLKGIAIGNSYMDESTNILGTYDYFWTHALNSDETNLAINKYCKVDIGSGDCQSAQIQGDAELGDQIDIYNIYAPLCMDREKNNGTIGSVHEFDPCTADYVMTYLNHQGVQKALHVKYRQWSPCSELGWSDSPTTTLPIIKKLIGAIKIWIYSGDTDGRVPVTSSRHAINSLKLPIKTSWYPWLINNEVAGYAVEYKGLVFATVRGAGHLVPSYQPERALVLISSFLQGKLPPVA